jgi:hypothetical protein
MRKALKALDMNCMSGRCNHYIHAAVCPKLLLLRPLLMPADLL